jgi:uncharacterized membrane protein
MSTDSAKVWDTLLQADLVQGDAPETDGVDSPWYVKVLLAISGWLAALFLLGFFGFGFELIFRNAGASLIVGAILIGAAFALLRMPKNEFYEHVALAVSLAGQALIAWPLFDNIDRGTDWLLISIFQSLLALLMPNYIHRVFSSFLAASCFSVALAIYGIPYIVGSVIMFAAAWLWLHEFAYPQHMHKQRAIGYGLVLALIQIKGSALYHYSFMDWFGRRHDMHILVQPWVGELLAGAVTLYVVWQILRRLGLGISEPIAIAAMIGTALLAVVSMEAHGITVGMLIILLGFAGSNRVLMGLGIISLLFYISSYYYQLHATLLDKSITLLTIGVVLITARWLLLRMAPDGKGVQHG